MVIQKQNCKNSNFATKTLHIMDGNIILITTVNLQNCDLEGPSNRTDTVLKDSTYLYRTPPQAPGMSRKVSWLSFEIETHKAVGKQTNGSSGSYLTYTSSRHTKILIRHSGIYQQKLQTKITEFIWTLFLKQRKSSWSYPTSKRSWQKKVQKKFWTLCLLKLPRGTNRFTKKRLRLNECIAIDGCKFLRRFFNMQHLR